MEKKIIQVERSSPAKESLHYSTPRRAVPCNSNKKTRQIDTTAFKLHYRCNIAIMTHFYKKKVSIFLHRDKLSLNEKKIFNEKNFSTFQKI